MRAIVEPPALRQARHGLVDTFGTKQDGRWENGVTFTPHGCHVVFGHAPDCPSEDKSDFQECSLVDSGAWLLESGLVWAAADLKANPKDMVRDTLDFGTSAILERLTSNGIEPDVPPGTPIVAPAPPLSSVSVGGVTGRVMGSATMPPTLSNTAINITTGFPTVAEALGTIEAKLLDAHDHTGSGGTILMSPVIAARVADNLWCAEEHGGPADSRLYTKATHATVVVGNFDPGTIWGVVGDIDVYLGDIEVFEAFTHKTNEYAVRAERFAVAVWNCQAFGALLNPL